MIEERMIPTELKLPKSEKPMKKRHSTHQKREFPWHIIIVSLGILSFLLLLATSTLRYMLFQRPCKCGNESDLAVEYHSSLPTSTEKQKSFDIHIREFSYCVKTCYYISTEKKTWFESKKVCQDQGADLLKIDDREEQNFIQTKIKYNYWIGLHRQHAGQFWLWLDGTALSRHLDEVMVGYQPQAPFVYGGKRKSIFQMEMLGQPVHSVIFIK